MNRIVSIIWVRLAALPAGVASLAPLAMGQVSFDKLLLQQVGDAKDHGNYLSSGDVDGDESVDIAVLDSGWMSMGRAWVLFGPDFQSNLVVPLPAPSPVESWGPTWELADVNGDGLDDLLLSASTSLAGTPQFFVGRATVLLAPTFASMVELAHPSPGEQWKFGSSMAAHDFTGDGLVDVAVGSPDYESPETGKKIGRIDIFSGSDLSAPAVDTWMTSDPHDKSWRWGRVLEVGDYDSDGTLDLLTSGLDLFSDFGFTWLRGCQTDDLFKWGFPAIAGSIGIPYWSPIVEDLNVDSHLDYLAGEVGEKNAIGIGYGSTFDQATILVEPAGNSSTSFGTTLDVGDFNRDGLPDLAVGMPEKDSESGASFSVGRVSIYYGPDYALTQDFDGAHGNAFFGVGVHAVDMNADGFDELVVGAGLEFGGRLYLFVHHTLRILGVDEVSIGQGGIIRYSIEAGGLAANKLYVLAIGSSGSDPGLTLPTLGGSVHVPLNPDALTTTALAFANTPVFEDFVGVTDSEGIGTPNLHIPPLSDPALAGTTITAAAVILDATASVDYATEAVDFLLMP